MGHRPGDAVVEIWNGMPFLVVRSGIVAPASCSCTTSTREMWGMVLPLTPGPPGAT